MRRRAFLAGAGGALLATPSIAAPSTSRRFDILRGGSEVGFHTLEAVRAGDRFEVAIEIEMVVRVLGIAAYRYVLSNREVWSDGQIISVDSRVNDDGDREFSSVKSVDGVLMINGSGYSGSAEPGSVTTSYLHPDFMMRSPWISTQTGAPLAMRSARISGRTGWYSVSGGYEALVGYDAAGEWIGLEFDAGGETASYRLDGPVGLIGKFWTGE